MKRKNVLCCVALSATVALGGCLGVWNGLGDDPMPMVILTKTLTASDRNQISYTQFLAVQEVAMEKKAQIGGQMSSVVEACFSGFWPYGIAGAAGGASGGTLYPNASMLTGPMAGVSGLTYGFGGCVNGAVTHSYAHIHALGAALEQALRDHERDPDSQYRDANRRSLFHNIHATAAFTRSRNSMNSPAPGLMRSMQQRPQWGGPPAGYPRQYRQYPQYAPQAPYPVQPPPQ